MKLFFAAFSKYEKIILLIVAVICCNNLFIDIMKVDAAQYASISMEMMHSKSFLHVKDLQADYLDKPPLLFWMSGISMYLFGVSNIAYKLAALIMLLLALYSIFRFSVLFYSTAVAKNAVLVFATCQAFFLMTNDVRTDGLLTSSVITAVWLVTEFIIHKKTKHLLLGAFFTALAMMSKGPVGLIVVLVPIGAQLLYLKQWKTIFDAWWIVFLLVVALLLFPMSYGLYTQFDMHPEKIVNGRQNQSGLYFYYWLQSFGRITGENVWNNGLPWHFFLGSIIWDFFPWIFVLYFSIYFRVKKLANLKHKVPEIITLAGFVWIFAIMSSSKYKLPHYIFVGLPFAAILCGVYLEQLSKKAWKRWKNVHFIFGCIVLVLLMVYPVFFFRDFNLILYILIALQLLAVIRMHKITTEGLPVMIGYVLVLNLFLSFVFYPKLLTFQADSVAGKWFYRNHKSEKVYLVDKASHSFNFYTKNPLNKVVKLTDLDTAAAPFWVYTDKDNAARVSTEYEVIEKKCFAEYPVTRLKLNFLLADTRKEALHYKYLLKLKKRDISE